MKTTEFNYWLMLLFAN